MVLYYKELRITAIPAKPLPGDSKDYLQHINTLLKIQHNRLHFKNNIFLMEGSKGRKYK